MSIVNDTENVRQWLEDNVCPLVKLKLAPPADMADDKGYQYQLVHPYACAIFVPTRDRLPPTIPGPIPSVCVRLIIGQDDLIHSKRAIKYQLAFSAWDPGLHGGDLWRPHQGKCRLYGQPLNEAALATYERNGDGWRDAWNFVDTTLRMIESTECVGGLRLIKDEPVEFGPFSEQESIPDLYPYWFAWVEFKLEEHITRAKDYDKYL